MERKWYELYEKVNEMMEYLSAEGEINALHPLVEDVSETLSELDDGVYLTSQELEEKLKKEEEHGQRSLFDRTAGTRS